MSTIADPSTWPWWVTLLVGAIWAILLNWISQALFPGLASVVGGLKAKSDRKRRSRAQRDALYRELVGLSPSLGIGMGLTYVTGALVIALLSGVLLLNIDEVYGVARAVRRVLTTGGILLTFWWLLDGVIWFIYVARAGLASAAQSMAAMSEAELREFLGDEDPLAGAVAALRTREAGQDGKDRATEEPT